VKNCREEEKNFELPRRKWHSALLIQVPPGRASWVVRTRVKLRIPPHLLEAPSGPPRFIYIYIYIYIYVSLCFIIFLFFLSNSFFSHFFLLYNLFLWTIKYFLHILLYFSVVKLILVIYPLNFILKMMNNIRDIIWHAIF